MMRTTDLDRSQHNFRFTRRWFLNRNLRTFVRYVFPEWRDKPNLTYLELGVFEGMSLVWVMQRVLTHSTSRAVGIDPWLITTKLDGEMMKQVRKRAFHNLSPWMLNCQLIQGSSTEVLRKMCGREGFLGIKKESVDLCMIDGGHISFQVLDDARHVLRLLKPGGWILFDDVENDHLKKNHVKLGIAMWLEEAWNDVEFLWKDRYMECYQKR